MSGGRTRVAITGGAGFIGSHVVDALLARGHEVVVIDDLSSGDLENLAHHKGNAALHIEQASVLDEQAMLSLLRDAQQVFHLATRNVRLSLRQPTIVHEVNTTGTLNVLKAAAAARAQKFVYCSSSEVNGTAIVVPMVEDYNYQPETIYGASKLTGEYYTQVFHRSGWLNTVIVRPHNNYGPREHYKGVLGEVIPRFILKAFAGQRPVIYGDGLQTRDFTYVTETAEYMIRLAESDKTAGETFNVCRGEEVSIKDIAQHIMQLTGLKNEPEYRDARPSDVRRLYGSAEKLKRVMGGAPAISIGDGLAKTVEWFRAHVPVNKELLASLDQENWHSVEAENWLSAAKYHEQ